MKFGKITTTIFMVSFLLTACFPAPPTPTAPPAPTATLDPCATVQFVLPAGARDKENAKAFPVESEITIQWAPADCVLTVHSYQESNPKHPEPLTITETVVSGDKIKIGEPGSGETEIKIWWREHWHSTWVWIE